MKSHLITETAGGELLTRGPPVRTACKMLPNYDNENGAIGPHIDRLGQSFINAQRVVQLSPPSPSISDVCLVGFIARLELEPISLRSRPWNEANCYKNFSR